MIQRLGNSFPGCQLCAALEVTWSANHVQITPLVAGHCATFRELASRSTPSRGAGSSRLRKATRPAVLGVPGRRRSRTWAGKREAGEGGMWEVIIPAKKLRSRMNVRDILEFERDLGDTQRESAHVEFFCSPARCGAGEGKSEGSWVFWVSSISMAFIQHH